MANKNQGRRFTVLSCAAVSLLAIGVLLLRVGSAHADDGPYDAEGNGVPTRILCPSAFPSPGWAPARHYTKQVPKWNMPAGDAVPIFAAASTWNGRIQYVTVGFGWYDPDNIYKTYQGVDYRWESDAPAQGAGIYVECYRVPTWFGLSSVNIAWDTGTIWGHAFPIISLLNGTNTRNVGGGSGEGDTFTCYEYFEWWFDEYGNYHEAILDEWCEVDEET